MSSIVPVLWVHIYYNILEVSAKNAYQEGGDGWIHAEIEQMSPSKI